MASGRNPTPSYLTHKQSGRARAVWYDAAGVRRQTLLPGPHGSQESRTAFARLLLVVETAPHRAPGANPAPSVSEVLLAFLDHAERYYRHADGTPTSEVKEIKASIAPVRELYGMTPAAEFDQVALGAVRQHMVHTGLCRSLINRRVDRVKRAYKWAASEKLVPATVYGELRTVVGLKAGRSAARESEPVRPADAAHVAAALPHMNRYVRTMVELQTLTGMRPGEVRRLTFAEVERPEGLWWYRPSQHKTSHRGKRRAIAFGPRARAAIAAFLVGDRPPPAGFDAINPNDETARLVAADAYQEAGRDRDADLLRDLARPVAFVAGCVVDPVATVFSPAAEREERFRQMRARRTSKVQPSQESRKKASPKRRPGTSYTATTYATAISRSCDKAGVPHWHPNQLRHLFATEVRKSDGLEAAQVLLGHARADVTQVYAERNEALAASIAARIG
jgi:integrase